MKRKKIILLLSCSARNKVLIGILAASLIGAGGVFLSSNATLSNNTIGINRTMLAGTLNNDGNKACVINGNDNLVLYTSASDSTIKAYISVGEMLTINSYSDGYYNVTVEETGATGYISSLNMQKIVSGVGNNLTSSNETGYIINVSTVVNVRENATMNSTSLKQLKNNTSLTLLGKQGEWYKVDYNGTTGYIYEEYIAVDNTGKIITSQPTSKTTIGIPNSKTTGTPSSSNDGTGKTANPTPAPTKVTPVPEKAIPSSSTPTPKSNPTPIKSTSGTTGSTPSTSTGTTSKTTTSTPTPVKSTDGTGSTSTGKTTTSQPTPKTTTGTPSSSKDGTGKTANPTPVKESAPVITASNITINQGTTFNDSMLKATTNDGATLTYSGTVNTEVAGTYNVTITAKGINGLTSTKTVVVTVKAVSQPASNPTPAKTTPSSSQPASKSTTGSTPSSSTGKTTSNPTPTKSTTGSTPASKTTSSKPATTSPDGTTGKTTSSTPTPVKESAPTLTAKSITVAQGSTFSDSQLGATATQDAKITYSGNVDTSKTGTYEVTVTATNSIGETSTKTVTVTVEGAPTITANNISVKYGSTFNDSLLGATATQGATLTYSGSVDTSKAGTYDVTITAKNSLGETSTKTVIVTVEQGIAPVITANNGVMKIGTAFNDSILGISATENGQSIQYTVNSSDVNVNTPGTYNVTITATANGQTTTKVVTVTVRDAQPILSVGNITVNQGTTWNNDLLKTTAESSTGANLDSDIKITGTVNTSVAGTYTLTVSVTDSYGETTTQTVVVTVKPVVVTDGVASGSATFNSDLQSDLMNMINQYREANGESAYTTSSVCQAMGTWKANNMATRDYFSHEDPQGQDTVQALSSQYDVNNWEEAIGLGTSTYGQEYTPAQIMAMAKSVFTGFKNSPVHNAIMLSDSDSLAGLGVSVGSNGNIYYSLEVASQAYSADTTSTFGSSAFNTQLRTAMLNAFGQAQPTWEEASSALNSQLQSQVPDSLTELTQFNSASASITDGNEISQIGASFHLAITQTCSIQSIVDTFESQMKSYSASTSSETNLYDVVIRKGPDNTLFICLYTGDTKSNSSGITWQSVKPNTTAKNDIKKAEAKTSVSNTNKLNDAVSTLKPVTNETSTVATLSSTKTNKLHEAVTTLKPVVKVTKQL